MSDYSISPLDALTSSQQKGYVGLYLQQGVPLLDRDLNLLQDLIQATVRSVFSRYLGNGIPEGRDGFQIQPFAGPQDFVIAAALAGPGTCMVGGVEVAIPASIRYTAQAGAPALTTPSAAQPDPRTDMVYLDVSFAEVDSSTDSDLNNNSDVGMETSVRLKAVWTVRVSEGVPVPAAPAGHVYYSLAQVQRSRGSDTILAAMITDMRQSRLTLATMEQRLALIEKILVFPTLSAAPHEFNPKLAEPGTNVTIFGNALNLQPVTVSFGGAAATIVGAPTSSQIVVTVPNVPAQASTITVTTAGGSVTSTGVFQILPLAPTLNASPNQFNPKLGPPTTTNVTIFGTNLNVGAVTVLFGATPATLVGLPTATQIVATVPVTALGAVTITVQTSAGSVVSTDTFTVT